MGLDSIQILVDIEECFDITIEDNEAERIRTVGELSDHVWSLVETKSEKVCFNQLIYFRLRKFVTSNSTISPMKFSPTLKISKIWDKKRRQEVWEDISKELELKIPKFTGWFLANRDQVFANDTIQELSEKIVVQNLDKLRSEFGLSRNNVNSIVISIIKDISGVDRKEIVPDATFTNDLGIN
ncbi:MAG: hypothetical protein HOD63_13845 [Bacteroidetes bacterium]|jgi:acyl carrier protein|nr:hypothetical protein [Bacteroidota bacterium]MBT5528133.1 hypothetical protein [Cytophagia bacterium]MBT3801044.1 hypothetical protein [Bacteroidota bacterium]MBT3935497.1 hypothetical protein [Bacteroidota bacterium]MBT4339671.1 hypothetical protein [Bacteroidota bacterium]